MKSMKKSWLARLTLLALLLLAIPLSPSAAHAAASDADGPIFLRLDGISGESADRDYEKWIEVSSADFSLSRSDGKPLLGTLHVRKSYDSSSIPWKRLALQSKTLKHGTLVYARPGKTGIYVPYLTLELQDIVVTGYSFDNNGQSESFDLQYTGVQWSYWTFTAAGVPAGKPVQGAWNFTADDKIAPVTTIAYTPIVSPPHHVTALSVTLAATDLGGSLVDRTEYRINGGEWQRYTSPFTIEAATTHTLEYRTIDKAGNIEATWMVDFVQGLPPVQPL